MRVNYEFELPPNAAFYANVSRLKIVTPEGELVLRLTEAQMIELIHELLPQAILVDGRTPELDQFRKALAQVKT